ncbi:hypothetical protein GLX_01350 [Komagataeibacter medellinensis NBRC 3288]|uniref:Uncharacterized protein n=1 Tax=Komagataeibacter medellinensis (strain NBRC 3288 / BCRC 11682 / LMG 1693 / Kondo 51) TaxID=634177 RepID=G2I2D1_KOMMN|nr:hypothetical protein GLX_01350 [Komagataeibacter medellinensis NBRC 3288]
MKLERRTNFVMPMVLRLNLPTCVLRSIRYLLHGISRCAKVIMLPLFRRRQANERHHHGRDADGFSTLRRVILVAEAGGFCSFEGWARYTNAGRAVSGIDYSVFGSLTLAEGHHD